MPSPISSLPIPGLTVSMRRRSWPALLAFAATLGTAPMTLTAQDPLALPDLGDSSARILSSDSEREYADALLRQLRNYEFVLEDAELTEYLETLAQRLVQASGRSGQRFHFALADAPMVNAFASPGGLIVAFSGLVLAAETESELAAVLAHEIAHVTQRHIARAMESAVEDALPILLGSVALALAARGQGDGSQAALVGGMALLQQRQINFTRDNEHEADRLGIQTLARAGFDPTGMSDFFSRLGTIYRAQGSDYPEYLRTHPVTTTRIAEAKARAEQVRTGSHRSSLEFALARERVRVLTARDLPRLVRYYRELRPEASAEPRALRYGMALALIRSGGASEAQPMLQELADQDPQRLSYQLALAEAERAGRQFDAAERRYQKLLAERPEHKVITLAYARTQIERDGIEAGRRAVEALRPLMPRLADDPQAQELYARASELAGDEVRAAEAHARAFFLRGRVEDALRQLEETARRPDLDYYERARIDAQVALWRPVVLRERQRNGERNERRSAVAGEGPSGPTGR